MKFLLWGVIGFIVVMWLLRTKKLHAKPDITPRASQDNQPHDSAETMVRCARCSVYIPASEAVISQSNAVFCSEEHRLQHSQAVRE